jgi:hypothetical protein
MIYYFIRHPAAGKGPVDQGDGGRTINYPVPYSSQGPKSCRSREKGLLWDGEVLIPDRVLPRRWIADLDVWAPRLLAVAANAAALLRAHQPCHTCSDDIRVLLAMLLVSSTVDSSRGQWTLPPPHVRNKVPPNESPRPATRPVRNSNPGAHDQQKCKERNAIQALHFPLNQPNNSHLVPALARQ